MDNPKSSSHAHCRREIVQAVSTKGPHGIPRGLWSKHLQGFQGRSVGPTLSVHRELGQTHPKEMPTEEECLENYDNCDGQTHTYTFSCSMHLMTYICAMHIPFFSLFINSFMLFLFLLALLCNLFILYGSTPFSFVLSVIIIIYFIYFCWIFFVDNNHWIIDV